MYWKRIILLMVALPSCASIYPMELKQKPERHDSNSNLALLKQNAGQRRVARQSLPAHLEPRQQTADTHPAHLPIGKGKLEREFLALQQAAFGAWDCRKKKSRSSLGLISYIRSLVLNDEMAYMAMLVNLQNRLPELYSHVEKIKSKEKGGLIQGPLENFSKVVIEEINRLSRRWSTT